jgi:cytochrome c biogenesis protein CcmG/thiol:disulfide interchange protein DsbE
MKLLRLIILITVLLGASNFSFAQTYNFELPDLQGSSVQLSSLLEKGPVFISFWALWCVPCKEEMRVFNGIYNKYKDSGFVYLAINQDNTKSTSKVKAYIESKGYDFPVLLDPELRIFETYGGQSLPFSLLLDKKGDIQKTYTGYLPGDEEKLEADIVKVIRESK